MPDLNTIYSQVDTLSLFELHRLSQAIQVLIDDPKRNEEIKRQLKIGMHISFFDSERNDLVPATITDIRRTRASVVEDVGGQGWSIKFSSINIEGLETNIAPSHKAGDLGRNTLKVGERVGWYCRKLNQELYGTIEKLNPKRAVVVLGNGNRWTVSYSLLFLIMDGAFSQGGRPCIEGEIIK